MKSTRNLKKFCRLTRYIEQIDPQLYNAIDDLCIGHYFKPSKESSGVTFLYPVEKAYRQRIINAAYSTDPDIAVNMLKSLIIRGFYESTEDFNEDVINLLNQRIEVQDVTESQVKLTNGLTLKKDNKFIPMSYRENMAVFELHGKGEIPLNGEVSSSRKSKRGGDVCLFSKKSDLHKLLADRYVNEIGTSNNIYVKKVYLQMKYIMDKNIKSCHFYLGNDEFSDSYLLDMYCSKGHSSCFNILYKCLMANDSRVNSITYDMYIKMKQDLIGTDSYNKNVSRSNKVLYGIRSPIEVRTKVCEEYGNEKDRLGKDLFIVFCNISKDMWSTSINPVDDFKEFAYIASNIYTKPELLINQEFDTARDLTLYGNLLKSDVFKYTPQADFRKEEHINLPAVSTLPSPLDMNMFSLCNLTNKENNTKKGGDPEVAALLSGL